MTTKPRAEARRQRHPGHRSDLDPSGFERLGSGRGQVLLALGLVAAVIALNALSLSAVPADPPEEPPPTARASDWIYAGGLHGAIAFQSDREGLTALYVMDPDGSGIRPLEDATLYEQPQARQQFSPDGRWQVFSQRVEENDEIFRRHVESGWQERLTGSVGVDVDPAWSPDGSTLAYVSTFERDVKLELYDLERACGSTLVMRSDRVLQHPTWSPDGRRLAFAEISPGGMSQIWIVEVDGGAITKVSDGTANDRAPVWLKPISATAQADPVPGSGEVAIWASLRRCETGGRAQFAFLAWDRTRGESPITRVVMDIDGVTLHDSGIAAMQRHSREFGLSLLAASVESPPVLRVRAWNAGAHRSDPYVITETLVCTTETMLPSAIYGFLPPTPSPVPSPTPVGPTPMPRSLRAYRDKILFKSDRSGVEALYVMNGDGSRQKRLDDPNAADHYVQAERLQSRSPDGSLVTFADYTEGGTGVYIYHLTEGWSWEVTRRQGHYEEPVWSADPNTLAYVSRQGESEHLFLIDLVDRQEVQLTVGLRDVYRHPTWSPDGERIAFWSTRETGRRQIWVMDVRGGGMQNLSQNAHNDWDPVWVRAE